MLVDLRKLGSVVIRISGLPIGGLLSRIAASYVLAWQEYTGPVIGQGLLLVPTLARRGNVLSLPGDILMTSCSLQSSSALTASLP